MEVALLCAALVFAVVNGANDGGALVAAGLNVPALRPLTAVGLLAAALVVAPLVLGTQVAATLVTRLVSFSDGSGGGADDGTVALLVAVVAAVAVAVVLSRRGLPTSLTLALVGGIAGAGLGAGLPVSWGTLGLVLAAGVAAPLLGGLAAFGLARSIGLAPRGGDAARRVRAAHRAGFTLQCVAYAANDGQKMFAVLAVATGGVTAGVSLSLAQFVGLAALFSAGLVLGLPRVGRTLGAEIVPVRPPNAVVAELSSAGAVLGSAALGAPVSMTQAVAGALVGSGMSVGARRVRWRAAAGLGLAWLVTLPASVALAAALARLGVAL